METLNALMQFNQCILVNLNIESNILNEPVNAKESVYTIEVKKEVRQHLSEPKFMIDIMFTFKWDESTFYYNKIEIGLRGYFSLPDGTDEETIAQYVPILCLTNLYDTARGMIAQATSLCPGGAFLLPLIDMTKLRDDDVPEMPEISETPKPKRIRKRKTV